METEKVRQLRNRRDFLKRRVDWFVGINMVSADT